MEVIAWVARVGGARTWRELERDNGGLGGRVAVAWGGSAKKTSSVF